MNTSATIHRRSLLLAAATAAATPALALAQAPAAPAVAPAAALGCPVVAGSGEVQLVGNSFPAVAHMARAAEGCARPGLRVVFKLTPQASIDTEQAFGAKGRSPFDAALVSMGTFANLYSRRQLQPLTDLVQRHGAQYRLEEKMLVRVDGEVMAIAFMQNTQNLYYRADLFAKHQLAVPTDYAQVLQAAAVLQRREPGISFPVAQGFAKGFDSGTEFVNLLASLGGRMFEPGSAVPAFNSPVGVQAINTMRSLMAYMTPNALASNSDDVMNQLQQGSAAMGVLWASRASRMDDAAVSKVVGKMAFAAAPSALPGGRSAAHLWWDGVVMPKNLSSQLTRDPARREAAFLVMMDMLSEASVRQGNDLTIWVRSAYRPGRFGTGVTVAQKAGAPVWPGEPFFSLAHAEVGKVLPDALKGERSPRDALAAAAQAYVSAATDKGFLSSPKAAA